MTGAGLAAPDASLRSVPDSDPRLAQLIEALLASMPGAEAISRLSIEGREIHETLSVGGLGTRAYAAQVARYANDNEHLDLLVRAALEAAPVSGPLRRVAEALGIGAPAARSGRDAPPEPSGAGVADAIAAIETCDDPGVREALEDGARLIASVCERLAILSRYKILHDFLHQLQMRHEQAEVAARSLGAAAEAADDLAIVAAFIDDALPQLRTIAAQLRQGERALQEQWIRAVALMAGDLLDAAEARDARGALDAIEGIGSIRRQAAPAINAQLVMRAGDLRFETFASALRRLARELELTGRAEFARPLRQEATEVERRAQGLRGLVEAHGRWQTVEELLFAASLMPADEPEQRRDQLELVIRFATDIDALGPTGGGVEDLRDELAPVERELGRRRPDDAVLSASIDPLRAACRRQFYAVDTRLDREFQAIEARTAPFARLAERSLR